MSLNGKNKLTWNELLAPEKKAAAEKLSEKMTIKPLVMYSKVDGTGVNAGKNPVALMLAGVGEYADEVTLTIDSILGSFESGRGRVLETEKNGKICDDPEVQAEAIRLAGRRCRRVFNDTVKEVRANVFFNKGVVQPSDIEAVMKTVNVCDMSATKEMKGKEYVGINRLMTYLYFDDEVKTKWINRLITHLNFDDEVKAKWLNGLKTYLNFDDEVKSKLYFTEFD